MFLHLVTSATYCGNLVLSGLGPGSALGEKEKKIGVGEKTKKKKKTASEANREVFPGGERVAPLGQPLADIFPITTPLFGFFPHCRDWSQAKY